MSFQAPTTAPPRCRRCGEEAEATWRGAHWCGPCLEKTEAHEKQQRQERFDRRVRANLDAVKARCPRMRGWSFESYPTDPAGERAHDLGVSWIGIDGPSVEGANAFIYGPVGTGKTGLAWSMMRYLLEHDGWKVDFINVRRLLADVRATFSDPSDDDPLEGLDTVELLVIDDLGAERPTDWALETIATLIEQRYQADLPTIVTSNYSPADLVKRLGRDDPIVGQRIVSRLVEDCFQIHLDGPDRRVTG